jgi:hypothetical protein
MKLKKLYKKLKNVPAQYFGRQGKVIGYNKSLDMLIVVFLEKNTIFWTNDKFVHRDRIISKYDKKKYTFAYISSITAKEVAKTRITVRVRTFNDLVEDENVSLKLGNKSVQPRLVGGEDAGSTMPYDMFKYFGKKVVIDKVSRRGPGGRYFCPWMCEKK